jgi:hypothetical protein
VGAGRGGSSRPPDQDAGAVLAVLRERGRKGLPCDELYRQMFNKSLYLLAYGNIYSNQGAMTPGACDETADGMSEDKIEEIIAAMRGERYRFAPVRRVYIPKKNGKLRPLGLPSWSDKLVGEVVRLLLVAYYEPMFSDHSHGFRKGRGCHTALRKVQETWTGTVWFIEGDISDCFGSTDHEILMKILGEKIRDNRFLRLIRNMLKAGYMEDWQYHDTLSGTPQGGVWYRPCSAWIHRPSLRNRELIFSRSDMTWGVGVLPVRPAFPLLLPVVAVGPVVRLVRVAGHAGRGGTARRARLPRASRGVGATSAGPRSGRCGPGW